MARKENFKKIKYEETLLHETNALLRTTVKDPRLQFVSVTKVEVTNDYAYAKVYWDTHNNSQRGDAKKAIGGLVGKLRAQLAHILKVRQLPHFTFIYDSQFEDELVITKLLESEKGKLSGGIVPVEDPINF